MKTKIILFILVIMRFSFFSLLYADDVYFKDGRTMKGFIVENDQEKIVLSTINGEILIRKSDITQFIYDRPEYNYLYLGDQYINLNEFNKAVEEYKKALKVNPEFKEAADAIVRALETKLRLQAKEIGNIGIEIEKTNEDIIVSSVAPDSDAEKKGIKKDDLLLFIWDKPVRAMELDKVKELLSGPLMSSVKIIIERQFNLLREALSKTSKVGDIGTRLKIELSGLMVANVIKNSPAEMTGIKSDDIVVKIDEESTRYMKLNEAKQRLAGQPGSQIKLTIKRTLEITRDRIVR